MNQVPSIRELMGGLSDNDSTLVDKQTAECALTSLDLDSNPPGTVSDPFKTTGETNIHETRKMATQSIRPELLDLKSTRFNNLIIVSKQDFLPDDLTIDNALITLE